MRALGPPVPLSEVLRHRKEFVEIDDRETYKRCRVQLRAQGIVLRDMVQGAQLKTKTQQVCRAGEFLVAEIDAKVGGFGVVPVELEGAIVSSHYFLFTIDSSRLDPAFLEAFVKTRAFQDQVSARGSTNYAAIRPAHVLGYQVPLPPIEDQRRIVAMTRSVSDSVAGVATMVAEARRQAEVLLSRETDRVLARFQRGTTELASVLREPSLNGLSARPSEEPPGVPILRISSATRRADGLVDETDHKYLDREIADVDKYRLQPGDLLACRFNGNLHFVGKFALYAGESGVAQVYPDKLIRFRVDGTRVSPTFVQIAMGTSQARAVVEGMAATTAGNIGISARQLRSVPIPVPPIAEQERIARYVTELRSRVADLATLQLQTDAELGAVVPAALRGAFAGQR